MSRVTGRGCEKMGLAPSRNGENPGKSAVAKVPVPIFSQPRREFLSRSALGLAASCLPVRWAFSADALAAGDDQIAWHDVRQWGVEGRGWADTARYFDRLPARAESRVRAAVWNLSRHSAGMLVRFRTDAPAIHARYALLSGSLAMPHMPATGVSGLDLYARDEQGRDRWLAVSRPDAQQMQLVLAADIDALPASQPRLYTVYLPLYNGVELLEIGVAAGYRFEPVPPRALIVSTRPGIS